LYYNILVANVNEAGFTQRYQAYRVTAPQYILLLIYYTSINSTSITACETCWLTSVV